VRGAVSDDRPYRDPVAHHEWPAARYTPKVATRPVLRIFISSTAVDLRDYREKVRDAVLRLEDLPIGMETFSALGGEPAPECMRKAAEADAVVCLVAHRYGYVPPTELGGDGERSITWLEVDAAKRAGRFSSASGLRADFRPRFLGLRA
jgi:hypothetical protein